MEPAARRRLGDIFVDRGLIDQPQLEEALSLQRKSGGKLGEILVDLGLVTRMALAGVLSEQWDELRVTATGRKTAELQARKDADSHATQGPPGEPSVAEAALRER